MSACVEPGTSRSMSWWHTRPRGRDEGAAAHQDTDHYGPSASGSGKGILWQR
jgi:hypothetical protein